MNQKFLIYFTLTAAPLYLLKFSFFEIPFNLLEMLLILNIAIWILEIKKQSSKKISSTLPWQIIISIGLILFGTIISIATNNAAIAGLGILKSWFVLPLIFAYITYDTTENINELNHSLLSIYFSTSLVSIIAMTYKALSFVTYDDRLSAFYSSPNYLALYLAPGILLGCYFLRIAFIKNLSLIIKLLIVLSLVISLIVFYCTYSYAGWLAIILSLVITAFIYFPRKQFLMSFVCLSFLFLTIFFSQVNSQKFSNLLHFSERSSLSSRIMIWKASEKMLAKNYVFGIGPGNFQAKYLALQPSFPPYLEWAVPQPHNLFLAFWLQTGLFGLIGFLFLISFIFFQLTRTNHADVFLRALLFSFFLSVLFYGIIDTPFWKNDLAFIFWSVVGIFAAYLKFSSEKNSKKHI